MPLKTSSLGLLKTIYGFVKVNISEVRYDNNMIQSQFIYFPNGTTRNLKEPRKRQPFEHAYLYLFSKS